MSLEEKAYDFIKDKILNYQWLPGMSIREQDIAKELETSRTPVRRAFERLTEEGFLIKETNRGVIINGQTLSKHDIQERLNFIELMLTYHFQYLETQEYDFHHEKLEEPLENMEKRLEDNNSDFVESEKQFLDILLDSGKNSYQKWLVLQSFQDIFNQKGKIREIFQESRKEKLSYLKNLRNYLADNDYPYARREIRILINQLVLNLFQGAR
jgi:DNA-binding GntR family transcriptional regulator